MKPPPFVYLAPDTLGEAVDALQEHGTEGKVLAGGQSLVPMMNMRLARPEVLVDISRIPEPGGRPEQRADRDRRRYAAGRCPARRHCRHAVPARPCGAPARRACGEPRARDVRRQHRPRRPGGRAAGGDPRARRRARRARPRRRARRRRRRVLRRRTTRRCSTWTTSWSRFDCPSSARQLGRSERCRAATAISPSPASRSAADTDGDGAVTATRLALFGVADRPVRATAAEAALVGRRLGDEAAAAEVAALATDGIDFASDIHVDEAYRREAAVALVRRAVMDAVNTMEG